MKTKQKSFLFNYKADFALLFTLIKVLSMTFVVCYVEYSEVPKFLKNRKYIRFPFKKQHYTRDSIVRKVDSNTYGVTG